MLVKSIFLNSRLNRSMDELRNLRRKKYIKRGRGFRIVILDNMLTNNEIVQKLEHSLISRNMPVHFLFGFHASLFKCNTFINIFLMFMKH